MGKKSGNEARNDRPNVTGATKGKSGAFNARFVGIELLAEEKQQFRALLDSGEFSDLQVDDFIERGYKVTFTSDKRGGGVICTLSAPDADHVNNGLLLTGRGRDATTALGVVAFKDIYLCPDGLWLEAESLRSRNTDDIA